MNYKRIYNNPFYVFVEFWENDKWHLAFLNIFQFMYGVITKVISFDSKDRTADFRFVSRSKIILE